MPRKSFLLPPTNSLHLGKLLFSKSRLDEEKRDIKRAKSSPFDVKHESTYIKSFSFVETVIVSYNQELMLLR